MAKRLVCLLLVLLTLFSCPMYAGAQEGQRQFAIYVDGQEVTDAHAIPEYGITYVSIYNVSRALIPDAATAWPGGGAEMVVSGTGFTLSARQGQSYVVCNGRYLYTPGQVFLHPVNGDLLIPVRVLVRALGASLEWDSNGVYLTSGGTPLESGESFYNADEVALLARTIRHECGTSQPLEGEIAVGNVLLGRVASPSFPNTLYGVIYQPGQFSNSQKATPGERNYIAAKLALDGAQTVPANCYWFNSAGKSCWASRNKALICTIGSQSFYG